VNRYVADTDERIEEQVKTVQKTAATHDGDAMAREVLAMLRDSLFASWSLFIPDFVHSVSYINNCPTADDSAK